MSATDVLRHEHQIILLVLDSADAVVNSRDIHLETVVQMIDFFKVFADRCHHLKEEKYLFPKLCDKGMSSTSGPVAVMLSEHDSGRRYLKAISEALPKAQSHDMEAAASIRTNLRLYAGLLRAHIAKENAILFPMSDSILSRDDQDQLVQAFEKVEKEEIGEGVHERYHQFAHDLKKSIILQE